MTKDEITQLMNYNSPEVLADSLFVPNPHSYITIRGAREHNLKNVSIVLPKNKLVVFSGLSGSGKSSLVFDTIYAEGQRRYVESLSSYARQFLGLKEKPDLDSIDGLSPAISIDQKSTANNPRSTVGTITEIYDYLRLLYAKIGKQHCAVCGANISGESISSMIERLLNLGQIGQTGSQTDNSNFKLENLKGKRRPKKALGENNDNSKSMQITEYDDLNEPKEEIEIIMLAPIVTDQKGWHRQHLLDAKKNNFRRVRIDGQIMLIEEAEKLELNKQQKHSIEIVIDRLSISLDNKNRLVDSLETCLKFGFNKCLVVYYKDGIEQKLHLSKDKSCPNGHGTPGELAPRMFSFNSPHGACPVCTGLGVITEIDARLVVPNENLSIMEGAIRPLSRMSLSGGWLTKMFETLSVKYDFKLEDPWCKLDEKIQKIIFYGDDKFEGVITNLKRRYRESTSDASRRDIESYMTKHTCPNCGGARLKPESLAVTVAGHNIAKIVKLSISQGIDWFESLQSDSQKLQNQNSAIINLNSKNLQDSGQNNANIISNSSSTSNSKTVANLELHNSQNPKLTFQIDQKTGKTKTGKIGKKSEIEKTNLDKISENDLVKTEQSQSNNSSQNLAENKDLVANISNANPGSNSSSNSEYSKTTSNLVSNLASNSSKNQKNISLKNQPETTKLSPKDQEISKMILKEIIIRLQFLQNVGLKYLNLGRSADTLSGGEAQRIRLATQIGSGLTGVLYILDEPSIGLHQRDNDKLLETLERLRDLGNTVIVVEHDEDTMRKADFLVDIGPFAGKAGGNIVGIGTPEMVIKDPNSPTGRFLAGTETIAIPKNRREVNIKIAKVIPKTQQIKEIKEDWMLEIAKLVGK